MALLFLLRSEHHDHLAAFDLRWEGFDYCQFNQIVFHAVKHFHTDLLVGSGLAVTLDASARRSSGAPLLRWVAEGTAGLVLVNAGLALYGEAMKRRGLHDAATRTPRP